MILLCDTWEPYVIRLPFQKDTLALVTKSASSSGLREDGAITSAAQPPDSMK